VGHLHRAIRPVDIIRVGSVSAERDDDVSAAEEPLEIRLDGRTFVVTMRTPGADGDLAAGFLLSESIVRDAGEIAGMRHCERDENVLHVTLAGDATGRAAVAMDGRRHVTTTSACGVCGRRSIADLMRNATPVQSAMVVSGGTIAALPTALRSAQRVFAQTGGLHAAGLFDGNGRLLRVAEDVGRHNAVDKVLGAELQRGAVPLAEHILFVSGRTSFEIVQKAVMAGVPVVAAVSAPSSLAIDLARSAHVTLLGFVRQTGFNIYAHPERIEVSKGSAAEPREEVGDREPPLRRA
jgi:FdhD protein